MATDMNSLKGKADLIEVFARMLEKKLISYKGSEEDRRRLQLAYQKMASAVALLNQIGEKRKV